MHVQNREGAAVDPVPMLVAVSTAFVVGYAWGPLYLMELGCSVREALAVVTVCFLGATGAIYHRLVWAYDPTRRSEVPVELRLQRLFYAVLVGVGVLVLLGLPLAL